MGYANEHRQCDLTKCGHGKKRTKIGSKKTNGYHSNGKFRHTRIHSHTSIKANKIKTKLTKYSISEMISKGFNPWLMEISMVTLSDALHC